MENLRILFLCPQPLWPINTGARLRNYHLANALASGCEVTILQLTRPGDVDTPEAPHSFHQIISAQRGRSYTPAHVIRGLTGPLPITVLNYTSATVAETLAKTLASARFDAVQMESIHLFGYLKTIQQQSRPPKVILDWHNIESELMRRYVQGSSHFGKKLVAARTANLLEKLETTALRSFAAHTVVSEREKEKLVARDGNANVHVIPNGVDTAAFTQSEAAAAGSSRKTLLFVGSMDYHANSEAVTWFCSEIWPAMAQEFPGLDFKIVGRNPPASVQALASARISVTGTVDDVRPFYREALAVLVPLRVGGGTRLKILEAMAAGVPVVSTRLGAEGLAVENGRQILLADSGADMCNAIRALVDQPDLVPRLRAAARQLVVEQYDWAAMGHKLARILYSLS